MTRHEKKMIQLIEYAIETYPQTPPPPELIQKIHTLTSYPRVNLKQWAVVFLMSVISPLVMLLFRTPLLAFDTKYTMLTFSIFGLIIVSLAVVFGFQVMDDKNHHRSYGKHIDSFLETHILGN